MTAREEYNKIFKQYEDSKQKATSKYLLYPFFDKILGNIEGLDVMDLACGSGYTSRQVKEKGAKRVVGIDISEKQIELALEREKEFQQGIEYFVADVLSDDLTQFGQFDMITAVMLLHYSKTKQEIDKMLYNISSALKQGGTHLTVIGNPDIGTNYAAYGIRGISDSDEEGAAILVELCSIDFSKKYCEFTNYHWLRKTYEEAFEKNGFSFEEVPLTVSDEGIKIYGEEFWQQMLENPTFLTYRLTKK